MKISFLMNIKLYDFKEEVDGNLKVIWRIVPESNLETDVLDFTERFLRQNITEIKRCLLTIINSEYIYSTNQLKKLFSDKNNVKEIFLAYIDEKGGIFSAEPLVTIIEKIVDLMKIPSKDSGLTLSQKKFSEFQSEKHDLFD